MRKAHGQSKHTEQKQRHLQMFLDGGVNGWKSLLLNNPRSGLAVIDATAGSGYTDEGQAGSPLILNRHFEKHFSGRFHQLCCDKHKGNVEKLQKIPMVDCEIKRGNYQDMILSWLESLPYQPVFGLLYVDVNGIKEALDGIALFQRLRKIVRFQRIDLAFNLQLNAYKRHHAVIDSLYNGVPPEWLKVDLIDHMDSLANFKTTNFIRTELGELQEWVMLYGMHTDKVDLTRRSAGIIPYAEWRANAEFYLNGGRKVAPSQMRMQL
jgi:hypothetical protein